MPALSTSSGRTPKYARLPEHDVGELARLERADVPARPCAMAGLIVTFARWRSTRSLSAGPARHRAGARMAAAFWNARRTTSPTRPMPCESLESIAITPRSCSIPSAAIVAARTRWRTIEESPCTRPGSSTCTAGTIARCSSAAWTPNGTVGVVEEVRMRSRPGERERVGPVPAADALDVEGVPRAAGGRGDRVLDGEQLVHAVGVHGQLHVVGVGHVERAAQLLGARRRRPRGS